MDLFSLADLEKRRLRDIEESAVDDRSKMPVEKRKQERANVCAVDVGICRDDYFVVAQLPDIENVAYRGAERDDEILYLLAREHFVEPGAFNIQNFATKRQYCLNAPIAPHLGGATGRISLDDKKLRLLRRFALTIREFTRERHAVERALP